MVGRGTLQETICTVTLPRQAPCQGWVAAPALPWEWKGQYSTVQYSQQYSTCEWKGPLSTRDCRSPMLHP